MEKKISVVIPNYNGRNLLERNLPEIIKRCSGHEVIIIDDASIDGSYMFIKDNFPKVKLIRNERNLGFARSVNRGVNEAAGDLVLLLNSDVVPRQNFLREAVSNFEKKNSERLFAVGLADFSHEEGKIVVRGRGGAFFKKGFLNHFALEPKNAETLWVSGGSSLIDKKKFLALGGFDPIYAPFYWEDIDLCFRARKKGYICLFELGAEVNHFHQEGAIKKHHSLFFIKTVSYKNQFIFVWKNISDYLLLLAHLLWLPYHLIWRLLSFDLAFFVGFIWAISQIPRLVFGYQLLDDQTIQLSDREVLKKFAKP